MKSLVGRFGTHLLYMFGKFFYVKPEERLKLVLMSVAFFGIIGSYTIVRGLKDSLFTTIVGGRFYMGQAKLASMFVLIPAVLIFSRLVDRLRRSYLMIFYALMYILGFFVLGYFVGQPEIGLLNTQQSADRWFGWIIYFFLEGVNPFVVSLFWSFAHSVTSPDAAKTNYPIMVSASKLGGIVATSYACSVLSSVGLTTDNSILRDVAHHQHLFYASGVLLALVPIAIVLLYHFVPQNQLHGYEAAYTADRIKARQEKQAQSGILHTLYQSLEGLAMMVRVPYVMGIFGIVFFWELVNVFINFERVAAAGEAALTLSAKTSSLLAQDFWVHSVGLFITLFGTRALIGWLGERKSLLLVPLVTGILLVYYFWARAYADGQMAALEIMGIAYVLLKALNYAFASPLRESLYIPTTRSVKFKSKSWVDSFGTKFAKAMGGTYSSLLGDAPSVLAYNSVFFTAVIGLWMLVANLLGRRYEDAIKKGEVIGAEE